MHKVLIGFIAAGLAFGATGLTPDVSTAAKAGDFAKATQLLTAYRSSKGVTPEYLEAYSWVARGQLFAKKYADALKTAEDVRRLCLRALAGRKLDAEKSLPTALGATIEVTGQAMAGEGRAGEGVAYLREEMAKYRTTSIAARIQKNLNLLSLEGKPAPVLEISHSVTGPKPRPLTAHAGHPVLLFFWAHWCPDCKREIAVIKQLQAETGIDVVAPTQHYGYVASGEDALPSVETPYIGKIWAQYYAGLGAVETPLSEANFINYGVSTTPTMVLLNPNGTVKFYHPGAMTLDELKAALK